MEERKSLIAMFFTSIPTINLMIFVINASVCYVLILIV